MANKNLQKQIEDFTKKLEAMAPKKKGAKKAGGADKEAKGEAAKAKEELPKAKLGKKLTGHEAFTPTPVPDEVVNKLVVGATKYAICELCSKGFESIDTLIGHMLIDHNIKQVKNTVAALINPPGFTEKITESEMTSDQLIGGYVEQLVFWKHDLTPKMLLALVLDKFPLLYANADLQNLIYDHRNQALESITSKKAEEETAIVPAEQANYEGFLTKVKEMVEVLAETGEYPVPDQPITLVKKEDGGYAIGFWSEPKVAKAVPVSGTTPTLFSKKVDTILFAVNDMLKNQEKLSELLLLIKEKVDAGIKVKVEWK